MHNSAVMSNWYLLPVSLQKEFRILLLFMQRAQILTIGGIWPLNVRTFVSVSGNIFQTPRGIDKYRCDKYQVIGDIDFLPHYKRWQSIDI